MTVRQTRDEQGARLDFTAPWSSSDAEEIRRSGIRRLVIKTAPNLDFLAQAPPLEAIQVMHLPLEDISGVAAQTELRWLDLNAYYKTPVDFSVFHRLERLHLDWGPGAESIGALSTLTRLSINRYPAADLNDLGTLQELRQLRLSDATRMRSLDGIERFASFEAARLLALSRLDDLTALKGVASTLSKLELNTCRRIGNLDWASPLVALRSLFLLNCGPVSSLRPIESLVELEVFLFYESTNIEDGDLSPLLRLPRLRDTAFQDRRHYSDRRDQILAALADRSRPRGTGG